ncbi:MAG: hypothetical protein ACRDD7_15605 [Peptostreptococcaceae bacterium]
MISLRKCAAMLLLLATSCTQVLAQPLTQTEVNMRTSDKWAIEEIKNYIEVDVEITFYTSLICENTSYGAVDAQSNPLKWGTIAMPRDYKLGTKVEFDGIEGTFYGTDRGSKKHIRIKDDGTVRIDMFIPRKYGESDSVYFKRVNNYGRYKTTAKIYLED